MPGLVHTDCKLPLLKSKALGITIVDENITANQSEILMKPIYYLFLTCLLSVSGAWAQIAKEYPERDDEKPMKKKYTGVISDHNNAIAQKNQVPTFFASRITIKERSPELSKDSRVTLSNRKADNLIKKYCL